MRIILYTGKGGVGKTSVSAARALRLAKLGHRTLVMRTDAAHSLADSFDRPLGHEPVEVAPNLWAQEISVLHEVDRSWVTLQKYLSTLLSWRGMEDVVAEEMTVLPGAEELAGLVRIVKHYDSGRYDTIVVDCAPTGDTLRLLSFPEIARWWLEKLFPVQRQVAKILRPLARTVTDMPMPEDDVFESIKQLLLSLDRIHKLLADPNMTSVRIVLNAEKMVVKEAQRVYTYLALFGYTTDMVICNRLFSQEMGADGLDKWREIQRRNHTLVEECFTPVPIFDVPFFDSEVVGVAMLEKMGEAIFGSEDPARVFFQGKVQTIEAVEQGFMLKMPLPFATKEQVDLLQTGDELVVQVGDYKRNIILPRALATLQVAGAKLEGGELRIRFKNPSAVVGAR
ncbi:MAG TPA: TRC40/GET3/ArsA family transport-energizing ATPase [Chloroflexia bacterium]|nr:TRC40/GET3/ArsA family transport-energizing ATPase [Chloroflexia bacterium]